MADLCPIICDLPSSPEDYHTCIATMHRRHYNIASTHQLAVYLPSIECRDLGLSRSKYMIRTMAADPEFLHPNDQYLWCQVDGGAC